MYCHSKPSIYAILLHRSDMLSNDWIVIFSKMKTPKFEFSKILFSVSKLTEARGDQVRLGRLHIYNLQVKIVCRQTNPNHYGSDHLTYSHEKNISTVPNTSKLISDIYLVFITPSFYIFFFSLQNVMQNRSVKPKTNASSISWQENKWIDTWISKVMLFCYFLCCLTLKSFRWTREKCRKRKCSTTLWIVCYNEQELMSNLSLPNTNSNWLCKIKLKVCPFYVHGKLSEYSFQKKQRSCYRDGILNKNSSFKVTGKSIELYDSDQL